MTTARVLDGILKGATNGGITGAITGTIGAVAVKIGGLLSSTPITQVAKVSMLGNIIVGSAAFGYSAFFNKAENTSPPPSGQAGLYTFILTASGLLGEAITRATVGSDKPLLELSLALLIGNGIWCYLADEGSKLKEEKNRELHRPSP